MPTNHSTKPIRPHPKPRPITFLQEEKKSIRAIGRIRASSHITADQRIIFKSTKKNNRTLLLMIINQKSRACVMLLLIKKEGLQWERASTREISEEANEESLVTLSSPPASYGSSNSMSSGYIPKTTATATATTPFRPAIYTPDPLGNLSI